MLGAGSSLAGALLLAVAALTVMHADSIPVGSFQELNLAIGSVVKAIEITAPEIVFDHQLQVWHAKIESTIGATMSGGYHTRLFFLQNGSKLSLRGVNLVGGVASANCSTHCPHAMGGAIVVSVGGELRLHSVSVFDNRANQRGGAIYAAGSVTATDCTMSSNSARWGGAVYAAGASTVTVTNCTMALNTVYLHGSTICAVGASTVTTSNSVMTANLGYRGGAVYAGEQSTFIVSNCTMSLNSADSGGALYTNGDSTVVATNCRMTSNTVVTLGGAVYAGYGSTVIVTNCTMSSNSAAWGGAGYIDYGSTATTTNCSMISNHASWWGGAIAAGDDSTLTVTDCTMTLNSATWGGVLSADDRSTVVAKDCTMTSNSATGGGVLYTDHNSAVTATDWTTRSNSAGLRGGTVYSAGDSTVAMRDCTMTSNRAMIGGAVSAEDDAVVTVTSCVISSNSAGWGGAFLTDYSATVAAMHCTMTSNSARWGGAVVAGWNRSSLTPATTTLTNCVLASNTAFGGGAALLVLKDGIADLINSVFQSNVGNDGDDGVGVVNLNGQLQCDVAIGCLPVCTVCRDEEVPSLPPTRPPVIQVTATPTDATMSHTVESGGLTTAQTFVISALCAFFFLACLTIAEQPCRLPEGEESAGVEANLLQSPLMDRDRLEQSRTNTAVNIDGIATEHSSANKNPPTASRSPNQNEKEVELAETRSETRNRVPLPWSAIESSPAPIFVIDGEMRITSWSQGACELCGCDIEFLDCQSGRPSDSLSGVPCNKQGCLPLSR